MRSFRRRMEIGAAALAIPAGAALVLLAVRGPELYTGEVAPAFVTLAATGVAGLLALALAAARERRRRLPVLPPAAEVLLEGAATALGDAVLALDAAGRVAWANDPAQALAGGPSGALLGRGADALGPDLPVLLRGLGRGAAAGEVTLVAAAGAVRARAAAVHVRGPPALDVVVLRLTTPAAGPVVAPVVDEADILPDPARAGAAPRPAEAGAPLALAGPMAAGLARASASAALLRLALPPGAAAAVAHLGRLERELGLLESAVRELAAPLPPAQPEPVDLDALLGEQLPGAGFAPGVSVRRVSGGGLALCDAALLRPALLRLLRLAAAAMPSGGHLGLRTARREGEVVLEIADTGAGADCGLEVLVAERLVLALGGRLERAATPGRGAVCRLVLPAATGARPGARPARPQALTRP